MTVRDTLRGIGVRAGVLAVGGIVVGSLLASAAMKAAGTLMQVAAGATLLLVAGGVMTYETKKFRRQIQAL